MGRQLSLFILLSGILIEIVSPYPTSVPDGACFSMTPGHGKNPQTSAAPYGVQTSSKRVKPGEVVQVILFGNQPFQGFYLQGRTPDNRAVGQFLRNKNDPIKTHDCGSGRSNAVFHGVRGYKNNVEILWRAPTDYEGQVIFTASFVADFNTFWTFVRANPIVVTASHPTSIFGNWETDEFENQNRSMRISPRILSRKPMTEQRRKRLFEINSNFPYSLTGSSEDSRKPEVDSYFRDSQYLSKINRFKPISQTLSSSHPIKNLESHNVNFQFSQPGQVALFPMQITSQSHLNPLPNYHNQRHENKITPHNLQQSYPNRFEYNTYPSHNPNQESTFSPSSSLSISGKPMRTYGATTGISRPKTVWVMDQRFQNFKDVDDLIPSRPLNKLLTQKTPSSVPFQRPCHHQATVINHSPLVGSSFGSQNHLRPHHGLPPGHPFNTTPIGPIRPHHGTPSLESHHLLKLQQRFTPSYGFLVPNLKSGGIVPGGKNEPPYFLIPASKHDVDNANGLYHNHPQPYQK